MTFRVERVCPGEVAWSRCWGMGFTCCNEDARVVDVHHRDFGGGLLHNRHSENPQERKKGATTQSSEAPEYSRPLILGYDLLMPIPGVLVCLVRSRLVSSAANEAHIDDTSVSGIHLGGSKEVQSPKNSPSLIGLVTFVLPLLVMIS